MTWGEFDQQMARLTSTYGPRAYPDERKKLLFKEFARVDVTVFDRIVSRLIAEMAMAPMLPKFLEVAAQIRERQSDSDKKTFVSEQTKEIRQVSFTQYVVNLIDKDGMHSEAFQEALKVYGMPKLERIYETAKKKEMGG